LNLILFDDFLGKYYSSNGERYEGEWKDDIPHGQGKKEEYYLLFILILLDDSQKVSGSEMMEKNMKASGKMVSIMAWVRRKLFA